MMNELMISIDKIATINGIDGRVEIELDNKTHIRVAGVPLERLQDHIGAARNRFLSVKWEHDNPVVDESDPVLA